MSAEKKFIPLQLKNKKPKRTIKHTNAKKK